MKLIGLEFIVYLFAMYTLIYYSNNKGLKLINIITPSKSKGSVVIISTLVTSLIGLKTLMILIMSALGRNGNLSMRPVVHIIIMLSEILVNVYLNLLIVYTAINFIVYISPSFEKIMTDKLNIKYHTEPMNILKTIGISGVGMLILIIIQQLLLVLW